LHRFGDIGGVQHQLPPYASCRMQEAALATLNVKDSHGTGIHLVDPWHADP